MRRHHSRRACDVSYKKRSLQTSMRANARNASADSVGARVAVPRRAWVSRRVGRGAAGISRRDEGRVETWTRRGSRSFLSGRRTFLPLFAVAAVLGGAGKLIGGALFGRKLGRR